MYKIRALILWFIKIVINSFFRNKKVIVFSGVRRSGNHACIDWIVNSIAGEEVELQDKGKDNLLATKNERIVLLNEINFHGKLHYLYILRNTIKSIRKAEVVLLSLEDYVSNEHDYYSPPNATHIYVTRSVLSTIASRVTYNIRRAEIGLDRGDMNIDDSLFMLIRRLRHDSNGKYHIWSYDQWLCDENWRKEFLGELNLKVDIPSKVGMFGGGSSFLGQNSSGVRSMRNSERWYKIKWPERIVRMLEDNLDLLNDCEKEFVSKHQFNE